MHFHHVVLYTFPCLPSSPDEDNRELLFPLLVISSFFLETFVGFGDDIAREN